MAKFAGALGLPLLPTGCPFAISTYKMSRLDLGDYLGCCQAFATRDSPQCGYVTWDSVLMKAALSCRDRILPIVFNSPPMHPSFSSLSLRIPPVFTSIWPSHGHAPAPDSHSQMPYRVESRLQFSFPVPTILSRCSLFTTQIIPLKENLNGGGHGKPSKPQA